MSNLCKQRSRDGSGSRTTNHADVRKATYMTRGQKMLMAIKCPEERGQALAILKRPFEMPDSSVPKKQMRKPLPKGAKEGTSGYQLQPQCILTTRQEFPKNDHPTLTSESSAKEEASFYPSSSKSLSIHSLQVNSIEEEHSASLSEYSDKGKGFVNLLFKEPPSILNQPKISTEQDHLALPKKEEATVYTSELPLIRNPQQTSIEKEHSPFSSECSDIEENFVNFIQKKLPSILNQPEISNDEEHLTLPSQSLIEREVSVNLLLLEEPSILNQPTISTEQDLLVLPSESLAKEEASVYPVSSKSPSIRSIQQKSIEKEHSPSLSECLAIEEYFVNFTQKKLPSILNQPEIQKVEEHLSLPSEYSAEREVYVNLLPVEKPSILNQPKISTEQDHLALPKKEEATVYTSELPLIRSPQQKSIEKEHCRSSSECSAIEENFVNFIQKKLPSILNQPEIPNEEEHLTLPSQPSAEREVYVNLPLEEYAFILNQPNLSTDQKHLALSSETSANEEASVYPIPSKSPSICSPQSKSIEKGHSPSSSESSAIEENLVALIQKELTSIQNQPAILTEEEYLTLLSVSLAKEEDSVYSVPSNSPSIHNAQDKSLDSSGKGKDFDNLFLNEPPSVLNQQHISSPSGHSAKGGSNLSSQGEANVHIFPPEATSITNTPIEMNDKEHHNSSLYSSYKPLSILSSPEPTKRLRRNDRKNFCIFCFTLCSNFRRHLLRNHKNEMEVAEYLALLQTGGSEETEESKSYRNKIFEKLRNKGNNEYNKLLLKDVELCDKEDIEFLPSRRPKKHQAIQVEKYVTCSLCKSAFSKSSFRKHVPKCSEQFSVDDPDSDIEGDTLDPNSDIRSRKCPNFIKKFGSVNAFMAGTVSENLKKNIIPLLKLDDAVKAALKDPLIMSIASDFHSNHLQIKDKYVVTKKIHDGGKFLISVKNKDPSIKTLQDCFDPLKATAVLDTVREMCGTDSETGNVRIVGMPSRLSWLLNEGASRALVDSICNDKLTTEQKDCIKKNISEFNKVKKLRWRYVGSSNAELTRKRRKIEAPKIMPYDEDIKTFSTYLYEQETKLFEQLKKEQTCENYERLSEVTIAHIITLSRRRPAEAANAELNNYVNRNKKEKFSPTILETLDNDQRQAMEKLRMFVVPGKNEHEVPVLLTDQMTKNIDLLVSLRASFSIPPTNKLLFARPGLETPFSGTKVMGKLVSKCVGLKNPAHLTPTGLRHHVASMSQIHGDTFVNHLAKFMGHTAHIHKKNYQLPSEVLQRAVVGKELLAMEGTVSHISIQESPIAQDVDALNCNLGQNVVLNEDNDMGEYDPLPASTSRCKRRWTEEEKKIVLEKFRCFIELKKNPGLPKCREVIANCDQLKGRTAKQLNVMIDNINKGKLKLV